MLFIILGLCLWIPAVLGWGLPIRLLRRRLVADSDGRSFDLIEPLAGLALIGTAATLVNYFLKISGLEFYGLIAGWGLFAIRIRLFGIPALSRRNGIGWSIWLILCGLLSSGRLINYDTGLYHLQSILWVKDNVLPLGLVNLHHRFGYNSNWFTISAAIGTPFTGASQVDFFLANALLTFFWGAFVVDAALRVILDRSRSLDDLFLCLTPMLFYSLNISTNLPSASPDAPIILLTLFSMYFALKAFARDDSLIGRTWDALITAVIAITIKVSAAPLLLMPLCLFLIALKQKAPADVVKRSAMTATLAAVIITVPWLIRGVAVSGCIVYPIESTCIRSLPWVAPKEVVADDVEAIQGSAQHSGVAPSQVEANFGWVGAWWFENEFLTLEMEAPLMVLVMGICVVVLASRARQAGTRPDMTAIMLIFLVSAAGTGYWFLTAPDTRFGVGYFWSPGLATLALGLSELTQPNTRTQSPVWRIGRAVCISLIVVAAAAGVLANIGLRIRGITIVPQDAYTIDIPAPAYQSSVTVDGTAVNVPKEGDQCWAISIPCAPYFEPGLRASRASNGQFTAFFAAIRQPPEN